MRIAGMAVLLASACSAPDSGGADNGGPSNNVLERSIAIAAEPGHEVERTVSKALGQPCRTQDGTAVTKGLKAIGTEPFWAAEVDGRCVTYRTPEDQNGTRIWTKFTANSREMVWDGALRNKQFRLSVRTNAECSDGMSDRSYSLEAVLRVDGETRRGCAERL